MYFCFITIEWFSKIRPSNRYWWAIKRVSVKTTRGKSKSGKFQVQLKNTTLGADHNTIRRFDKTSCEIVFIVTVDGDMYEIPSECIDATCSMTLNEDYDKFKVSL